MTKIRSSENVELICSRIVDGLNLREIAKEIGCDASSIAHWLNEDDVFAQRYARAKEVQAEVMAADILAISDDGSNDWMTRASEAGEITTVADHEHIQRSKLRVDSRKWLMAKMAPKRYGDQLAITGKDGVPLITAEPDRGKMALLLLTLLRPEENAPDNPDLGPPVTGGDAS